MESPEFIRALEELAQSGLNIFASIKVNRLPSGMSGALLAAGVPLGDFSSLGLACHGGKKLWENIPKPAREEDHPVDNLSLRSIRRFLDRVAPGSQTLILHPSDEYVIPLQQLGRLLHVSQPSPLGLDLNFDYGPWFAFRVAFLTSSAFPDHGPNPFEPPCDSCALKPCLSACPASATGIPFKMPACADHRLSENSSCSDRCLARIACPYREEHRYTDEQIQYHMLRPGHLRRLMGYGSK